MYHHYFDQFLMAAYVLRISQIKDAAYSPYIPVKLLILIFSESTKSKEINYICWTEIQDTSAMMSLNRVMSFSCSDPDCHYCNVFSAALNYSQNH